MKKGIFRDKTVVVGITGGIAGYKALGLIRELRHLGAKVHVIMTEHSQHLVDPEEFAKASGNEVQSSLFHREISYIGYIRKNKEIKHISIADMADLFMVCPATANIIGKIANGIADDLLTTTLMATEAPILICPAMNVKMWKNPIVRENVSKLMKMRYHFVRPEYGELACGYKGVGRLADLRAIVQRAELLLKQRSGLKGKRILVTAGATSEKIDPVRVITNKSSGKMGVRIAEQAFLRGAEVILLRSANSVEPDYHIREEMFETVTDLIEKVREHIKNADIVIHSAAVSDFTVSGKYKGKISSSAGLRLELSPTTKIFEKMKKMNERIFLIGFKAEHNVTKNELLRRAQGILKKADADMVVANDVSIRGRGFNADTNEVYVVDCKGKAVHIPLADKRTIADRILDLLIQQA